MSLLPGARLGPYEILGPLGAGGMGEVYRAKDTRLGRDVAVKILPAHLSQRPESRERFEREARAISSLNHPGICVLYDVGREGDADYLVMELLDGETLASRLARGPVKLEEALRIGAQIADALAAAHRKGIIHRDLKPANVALTKSGAKVLDFGIAKLRDEAKSETATVTTPLTGQGAMVGTVQYMAPEQLEGKDVDHRVDLFAFGAVLYEMLTGKRAFEGESQASVIAAILERESRPVSELIPTNPPALDRVVKTCLAKDQEQRWQSAGDLARELRWIGEGSTAPAAMLANVAAPARSMPTWRRVVGAVVVLAAGIATGLIIRGERAGPTSAASLRVTIAPQRGVTPSFNPIDFAALTISPDGRYVTFAANDADGHHLLWLRPLDALDAKPLAGTDNGACPFWSPDSRSIAFFSDEKLKKVEIAGGPAVKVAEVRDSARSGSWNQDGVIIFATDYESAIVRVSANGGQPQPVTKLDATRGETTHRWARFLPDGKHFLYTAGVVGQGTESELNVIYVASLDDPTPKLVLRASSQAIYSAGHLLYMRRGDLVAQPFDLRRLVTTGDAAVIAAGAWYAPGMFRGAFDVSDEGTLYYAREKNWKSRLFWLDPDGRRTGPIGDPIQVLSLAVSPDETRIAVGLMGQRTESPDIWLYDASGKDGIPFAADPTHFEYSPVWSPDGTRIAFMGGGRGDDLTVKAVAGGRETILLKGSDERMAPTSWSPDGVSVLFDKAHDAKTKTEIWIVSTLGEPAPHKLIAGDADVSDASLSPDGRWILYTSDESGRDELYVQAYPIAGPRTTVSRGGVAGAGGWTRGGREIRYRGADKKAHSVAVEIKNGIAILGTPVDRGDRSDVATGSMAPSGRAIVAIGEAETDPTPLTLVTNWTSALK